MKLTGIFTVLSLALLAGCASAPAPRSAKAPKERSIEDTVIVPYTTNAPPGSMEVSWTPTEEPPPPEVKPRRNTAQPQWVTKKRSLFVLPTTNQN